MPVAGRHLLLRPPPQHFHLRTFGKLTGCNWKWKCLFPDFWMDDKCSTGAHEKQIRGSVQANSLAHCLTEKLPGWEGGPCPGRSGSCRRTQMRLQGSFTMEGKSTLPWPSGPGPRVSCCALRLCGGWEWQPQPSWPVIKITHRYSTSYPCHI